MPWGIRVAGFAVTLALVPPALAQPASGPAPGGADASGPDRADLRRRLGAVRDTLGRLEARYRREVVAGGGTLARAGALGGGAGAGSPGGPGSDGDGTGSGRSGPGGIGGVTGPAGGDLGSGGATGSSGGGPGGAGGVPGPGGDGGSGPPTGGWKLFETVTSPPVPGLGPTRRSGAWASRLDDVDARLRALRARLAGGESATGPDRVALGGGGGGALTDAAFAVDASVTRWQAAQAILGEFFAAYVAGDLYRADRRLAADVAPPRVVITNAMQDDHQREADIDLQVVLLNYQMQPTRVCTSVEWNRSGTSKVTGLNTVRRGAFQVCQDRGGARDPWRLSEFRGNLPFGLADAELKRQAAAGNPNPDPAHLPPPGGAAADRGAGPFAINLGLDPSPTGGGNVAVIDLETSAVRKVIDLDPSMVGTNPGEDLVVSIDLGLPPDRVRVRAVGGAAVANCGGGPGRQLADFASVRAGALGGTADDAAGKVFGVRTGGGAFALLRIPDGALASYLLDDDELIQPGGGVGCP